MIRSEAWILDRRERASPEEGVIAVLRRDEIVFSELEDDELLVEPLFGSWEGNMDHAVRRRPVDICMYRGEPQAVIGNSGVLRVVAIGSQIKRFREGDIALLYGNAKPNEFGFMVLAHAYDAPGTIGVLSKRLKLHERT